MVPDRRGCARARFERYGDGGSGSTSLLRARQSRSADDETDWNDEVLDLDAANALAKHGG